MIWRLRERRATTLLEMIFFGAIASVLLIAVIALLAKSTRIVELGRRTSGSQTDLRSVLEILAEDVGEIVQLEGAGGEMSATGAFSFTIRSSRAERGIPAGTPSLRKIEYKLEGSGTLKDVTRIVTVQGGGGGSATEKLVRGGVTSLKAWPVAAVPEGASWVLKMATDGDARKPGATVACLVVEISAGQESGKAEVKIEKDTLATIVTKLWCRNRVMELARGALR